jgi:hypothetical protein
MPSKYLIFLVFVEIACQRLPSLNGSVDVGTLIAYWHLTKSGQWSMVEVSFDPLSLFVQPDAPRHSEKAVRQIRLPEEIPTKKGG